MIPTKYLADQSREYETSEDCMHHGERIEYECATSPHSPAFHGMAVSNMRFLDRRFLEIVS
jgi:hypothetical protein